MLHRDRNTGFGKLVRNLFKGYKLVCDNTTPSLSVMHSALIDMFWPHLFKVLPNHLHPFGLKFSIIFGILLLLLLVTCCS